MSDAMDFVIEDGVLVKYKGNGGDVIIPSGVTDIGESAFAWCSGLTSTTIPSGVTSIGDYAFYKCRGLTSITIPSGVTSIGDYAFYECRGLTSITIPESVTTIGMFAFSGCDNLNYLNFDGSIDAWLAMDKKGLEGIGMPYGYTLYIDGKAVDSVMIPDGTTTISDNAFYNCRSLTSITIPESVTTISDKAFYACRSLTNITIPSGVTRIGKGTFCHCDSLTTITIPSGVETIGEDAFYMTNIKQVVFKAVIRSFPAECFGGSNNFPELIFPEDAFVTSEKLPAAYCKFNFQLSDREIAWLMLYQKAKAWDAFLRKNADGREKSILEHMLARFADDPCAPAAVVGEYLDENVKKLTQEQIKTAMELLEKRNYSGVDALREIPEVLAALSGAAIEENPIEIRVREFCEKSPLLPEAIDAVKKGIPYAETKLRCSCEAVAFILSEYAREWNRCVDYVEFPRYNSSSDGIRDGRKLAVHPEADEVAAALDRSALLSLLENLISGNHYRPWMVAWARFADDHSIGKMTSRYKTEIKGKAIEFYKAYSMRESLLINDTRAAMQFFDRIDMLPRYAEMRGMTAMEMRDSMMLPDFGFDAEGVKRYDIGGNAIEVSIAPNLSFKLFDVNKQKEIRSFPKKSDDPAKAEARAKEFAAFKQEVLDFAKARTELLHKMHMSGEYVQPDLWRKVYAEHPVISKLARLVVWQDESGKTFMIADGGITDSGNNSYAPQGRIRVAHVLEMEPAEVTSWQQWLANRSCVQLFEQVWEPVICWEGNVGDRYVGVTFINKERNAVKKALKQRGVNMRAEEMLGEYNYGARAWDYGSEGMMLFGNCLKIKYTVDEETKDITFGKASVYVKFGDREMNATLLEMDKAAMAAHIIRDNDACLTDQALSIFSAAQITGFTNLAIDHKSVRCTARMLDYKNARFPEFAEINEFSLDW